jgi:exopolysaccharide production protein ExoZ
MNSATRTPILSIQYLRAIAASMVVFHHAMAVPELAPHYSRPIGQFGVDLFFVISGLIMWTTTKNGQYRPLNFYVARIIRVVPVYWFYTTLFLAMALFVPGALFTAAVDPLHVLKSYLFIPAEHPRGGTVPLYTLGWTLNYEMFFYFIFGLCLFIENHVLRLVAVIAVLTILAVVGRFTDAQNTVVAFYANPIILEFAFGVLIAEITSRIALSSTALGFALIAVAVACLAFCYTRDTLGERILVNGAPAAIMVVGALLLERKAQSMPSRLGKLLGDASYSIYLAHPFAMRIFYFAVSMSFGKVTTSGGEVILAATEVIAGIAGGVIGYFILERPIMGARRWMRTRKAAQLA